MSTFPVTLTKCKNPACDRKVPVGTLYCCGQCSMAHDGKYEIHEDGPLAHAEGCNRRHEERSGEGLTGAQLPAA